MKENNLSSAPFECPTSQVFEPYFRARWQNFQNIVSRATFFSKMPSEWITYQNVYVRQWEEWASGFVLSLHRGDFFSTGMGKTVVDILVKECMRGNYRFDSADSDASKRMSGWADENNMQNVIMNGFYFANRIGNAILRLNLNVDTGDLYPTVHPVNRTYFQVNRKGQVVKARFFDLLSDGTTKDDKYVVVEDRVMLNGSPYYRVNVYRFTGTATNPELQANETKIRDTKRFGSAKSALSDLYGEIELDTWYKLPFKTLGCYNWQNTSTSSAISEMEGYSDSSLHTALDILYAIDYNYSMGQLDQYFGRSFVLLPPEMEDKGHLIYQGVDYEGYRQIKAAPLAGSVFVQVPSSRGGILDGPPVQPQFIQSDLRGVQRKEINDFYLELLASKVGLSSSTLANHLTYNQSKTATEIDRETDTTDVTVANKRALANLAINAMLADICAFFDIEAEVDITWNRNGTNNKDAIIEEYARGTMPLKECISRLHPELTKLEVEEWVAELQQEKQASPYGNDINSIFGLGDEH